MGKDKKRFFGVLKVKVHKCKGLINADLIGKSDPYVVLKLDGVQFGRTKTIDGNLNPVFEEEFQVGVRNYVKNIEVEVWDEDPGKSDDLLGTLRIPAKKIKKAKKGFNPKDYDLSEKKAGEITLSVAIFPFQKGDFAVPDVGFSLRDGCRVVLYQNAHIGEDAPPENFRDPEGNASVTYVHRNCWEDIHNAFLAAKRFIYITGWSVNTAITLLRRVPKDQLITIGELLKKKAAEGVTVRLQLWNEKTSNKYSAGLMGTSDEITKTFFENSPVKVVLAYRTGSMISDVVWTHHQKSVILDADSKVFPGKRRIVAFVGGLDLTDGRWDTPKHPLFSSLFKEHKYDFHQVWPGVDPKAGPRGPWRDIHSYLEGPVARDVLKNFLQRWQRQAPDLLRNDAPTYEDDPDFLTVEQEMLNDKHQNHGWHVQFFRSIDQNGATISGVDNSIQMAYINTIRSARRFIYIENQYFIGSSQYWSPPLEGAPNLIAWEICQRISYAIQKGKRFTAYIVIPLYPEGYPGDNALQEVMKWERNTMAMMYREVAAAIKESGLKDAHPSDYLNFYCLGNRVTSTCQANCPADCPAESNQLLLFKSKRYQVYVHSKFLVADDIYAIVGSANINERSMAGNRDSEIAIGAFQKKHTSLRARGYVHKFRMAVWSAHLQESVQLFLTPEDLKTVRYVNKKARENWDRFAGPEDCDMTFFLMSYPIEIDKDGKVTSRQRFVPDTNAPLEGDADLTMPDFLTM